MIPGQVNVESPIPNGTPTTSFCFIVADLSRPIYGNLTFFSGRKFCNRIVEVPAVGYMIKRFLNGFMSCHYCNLLFHIDISIWQLPYFHLVPLRKLVLTLSYFFVAPIASIAKAKSAALPLIPASLNMTPVSRLVLLDQALQLDLGWLLNRWLFSPRSPSNGVLLFLTPPPPRHTTFFLFLVIGSFIHFANIFNKMPTGPT